MKRSPERYSLNLRVLFLFLLFATMCSLAQNRYYKGNTHSHCYPKSSDITNSSYSAENIVASYKAKGYDFLVFTDHVNYWYAGGLSTPDFTVISGSEPGISGGGLWGHFTAIRITSNISGSGKTHQQLLDAIAAQGGIAFLNHPRWSVIPITARQVINDMKQNLSHVEVYNGATDSPTNYDSSLWDSVLTTGRVMFGVASDDSHKETDQQRGWICVYASSRHPDTLVNAIRRGDFYASNGIVLDTVGYAPEKVYVKSTNGTTIRFIGSGGSTLAMIQASEVTYVIQGNEGYVRAEIRNNLNQTAWIQPLVLPTATKVRNDESSEVPGSHVLFHNYPNPFNSQTSISFHLAASTFVTLGVFDVVGRNIVTLVHGELQSGYHRMIWRASGLPSGAYVCRLQTGDFSQARTLILLK